VAKILLQAGARVTICGRSSDALHAAAERLSSYGKSIAAVKADVRERNDCERLITAAAEQNGPVDVLVNDAGVFGVGVEVGVRLAPSPLTDPDVRLFRIRLLSRS
jgi:NADP-dependent 3-hydroxy acid dehydrogenase YdfG